MRPERAGTTRRDRDGASRPAFGLRQVGSVTIRLLAGLLIILCLVIGVVGLVLPIIPGIVFLGLAALIAVRHSPSLERVLRKNRTIDGYLDRADTLATLSLGRKIQVGVLLCLKILVDGAEWTVAAVGRILRFATSGVRRYRGPSAR
ncbi:MAG: DUF454 family protein [Gammaproteobacteria bacterium]